MTQHKKQIGGCMHPDPKPYIFFRFQTFPFKIKKEQEAREREKNITYIEVTEKRQDLELGSSRTTLNSNPRKYIYIMI